ncbi:hypothetical protein BpHYR1_017508 [Brachionus plicatilis]|uniref:Uncharacterized protein n=1 Tax=Brachionus plicatilis TaxID=10195 RepID=A0A3M7RLR2_BRAPC|nr:hypothetical protein BpHYR1_017508 [Brachionus plicatilis]
MKIFERIRLLFVLIGQTIHSGVISFFTLMVPLFFLLLLPDLRNVQHQFDYSLKQLSFRLSGLNISDTFFWSTTIKFGLSCFYISRNT